MTLDNSHIEVINEIIKNRPQNTNEVELSFKCDAKSHNKIGKFVQKHKNDEKISKKTYMQILFGTTRFTLTKNICSFINSNYNNENRQILKDLIYSISNNQNIYGLQIENKLSKTTKIDSSVKLRFAVETSIDDLKKINEIVESINQGDVRILYRLITRITIPDSSGNFSTDISCTVEDNFLSYLIDNENIRIEYEVEFNIDNLPPSNNKNLLNNSDVSLITNSSSSSDTDNTILKNIPYKHQIKNFEFSYNGQLDRYFKNKLFNELKLKMNLKVGENHAYYKEILHFHESPKIINARNSSASYKIIGKVLVDLIYPHELIGKNMEAQVIVIAAEQKNDEILTIVNICSDKQHVAIAKLPKKFKVNDICIVKINNIKMYKEYIPSSEKFPKYIPDLVWYEVSYNDSFNN